MPFRRAADAQAAARMLARMRDFATELETIAAAPTPTVYDRARALYKERRRRDRDIPFAARLFSEPAWDMLLDLFIAGEAGPAPRVTSLCHAASVPMTTALRWVAILEDCGMITTTDDPHDRRCRTIELTPEARAHIETYLMPIER